MPQPVTTRRERHRFRRAGALLVLALGMIRAGESAAQRPDDAGWGGERALELIRRAQARRAAAADTGLVNYQARALGRVYFYLDREDTGERNLIKTDQLALDVVWQAPSQVKQRIVGWRDERSLPTNIRYHLDHLSVVQENFGEEIRIGDGDEVRGVPHPAAGGAERVYEYRLADSLTLSLPGAAEPVRVYQVETRPLDPDLPAFVGSVFIERGAGDIVRMDFTFTAAAYVDRYLDYINISLDNGLWRGRYWLPNEQRVEIRRRIPQLDVPAGSVIRANMRIGDYVFNEPLPAATFLGPTVVALPREQREAFEFEEPIDAELREEGLGEAVELGEIRAAAARLVRDRALRRFTGLRLGATAASDLVRYNRAEGAALGLALSARPTAELGVRATVGYAFGAEHPVLAASLAAGERRVLSLGAYLNGPRDRGIAPGASGAMNSISSLFGSDYTDLYYASGAEASVTSAVPGGWALTAATRLERHRSARREEESGPFGGAFREVRPIDELDAVAVASLVAEREATTGLESDLSARASLMAGRDLDGGRASWLEPRVDMGYVRRWVPAEASVAVEASAGAVLGDPPVQLRYLMGGRGTVPGFPFRSLGGSRFGLIGVVASADLLAPWIRGRALGRVGTVGGDPPPLSTGGVTRASLGMGAGLLYDILRVDLVRGLGDEGHWELVVEARPSFWSFL